MLVERFIASFERAPKRLVLDVDATDDRAHGDQEGRFYHGYYDHYCFLPLYVFCGDRLLVSYLRPSKIDGAKHSWAILALLIGRLRRAWPEVRITVRGDSGFCRWRMLRWFDRHGVDYVIGVARNARLLAVSSPLRGLAERRHRATGEKQRLFGEVRYGARGWDAARRVVVKAEHGDQGGNPRFVVTSLEHDPQRIYDRIYCARGDMENRIKEQQLDLFADRTSCHKWWANQFRLLLSSLAYTLLEAIRRTALGGTALARAQCGTLRLKLLRVGAPSSCATPGACGCCCPAATPIRSCSCWRPPASSRTDRPHPAAPPTTPCESDLRSPRTTSEPRNREKTRPRRPEMPTCGDASSRNGRNAMRY